MRAVLRIFGWLFIVVFLCIAAFVAYIAVRNFFVTAFPTSTTYYTTTADLSFDGERIKIAATTKCQEYKNSVNFPLVTPSTSWEVGGSLPAKRLPNGSALVVGTGLFCGVYPNAHSVSLYDENNTTATTPYRIHEQFEYVALLDKAEEPTRIDLYMAPKYFQRHDARIRIHSIKVEWAKSGTVTDASNETSWATRSKPDFYTRSVPFFRFVALIYPNEPGGLRAADKKSDPSGRNATLDIVAMDDEYHNLNLNTAALADESHVTLFAHAENATKASCVEDKPPALGYRIDRDQNMKAPYRISVDGRQIAFGTSWLGPALSDLPTGLRFRVELICFPLGRLGVSPSVYLHQPAEAVAKIAIPVAAPPRLRTPSNAPR